MKISVIIYADSPNAVFERCLLFVKGQSRQADEVIIMDTERNGEREALAREYLGGLCRYHYHEKEKRYHVEAARCRNQAAGEAGGDVLLFMNDDIILPNEHLQKLGILFESDDVNACVFRNRYLKQPVTDADTDLMRISYIDWKHLAKFDYSPHRDKYLIHSRYPWGENVLTCYAVESSIFKLCGGFDEQIAIYAGSDANFIYRISRCGAKIFYPPEMAVYVQQKERYPVVRWRASGGEYTAYHTHEQRAMEWFDIKTLWKRIVDYNRYHPGKCLFSRHGTFQLAARYQKELTQCVIVLLVDCVPNVAKTAQIAALAGSSLKLYIVSLLPEKSSAVEELMRAVSGSSAVFCHWRRKEEWEDLCRLLKLSAIVSRTSSNRNLIQCIETQKAGWIERKNKLEKDIINELDYEIYAQDCIVKRSSEELADLPQTGTPLKPTQYEGLSFKHWDLSSYPYKHEPGFSLPPRTISFRLTYMCNLRCKMCGQWGISGIYNDKDKDFLKQYLPIEVLKQVVDETAEQCPGMYYIWGGEPMLHPDYVELIRYIKQKGIFCTTTTNGMFLKKYARTLCEIGTEFIRISLDGTEKIHNDIRNNPNCYQTVMEGIREITDIKKQMHMAVYPILECDSVIIKDNYKYLEEYIETMSSVGGINSINFSHPIYSNPDVGRRHAAEFIKEFEITPSAWNGFVTEEEKLDVDELIEIIGRIQSKQYSVPVNFDPPMRGLDDIRLHYTNIEKLYNKRFCTVPWIWVEIHPDGNVSFCEDFCDYYIGNLYEKSFNEIWNSKAAQKYRKVLLRRNQFPICNYCGLLCHDSDF